MVGTQLNTMGQWEFKLGILQKRKKERKKRPRLFDMLAVGVVHVLSMRGQSVVSHLAYVKLSDVWSSALGGSDLLNFHDLNCMSTSSVSGTHITVALSYSS